MNPDDFSAFLTLPVTFERRVSEDGGEVGVLVAQAYSWDDGYGLFDPPRHPRIHTRFAGLNPENGDSLAKFASRYGLLMQRRSVKSPLPGRMETQDEWRWHIRKVRYLIEVHSILQSGMKTRERARALEHLNRESVTVPPPLVHHAQPDGTLLAISEREFDRFWLDETDLSKDDRQSPGYPHMFVYLHRQRLESLVSRVMQAHALVNWRMLRRRDGSAVAGAIFVDPATVLGAIYWSLVNDMGNDALPMRQCPGCFKWFRPERRDQRHHNAACRNRALYNRKSQR
jgi:hypothetical protein